MQPSNILANLFAPLFALALVELESSEDAADAALLQRLRAGTHSRQDAEDVVGLMECLADEQLRLKQTRNQAVPEPPVTRPGHAPRAARTRGLAGRPQRMRPPPAPTRKRGSRLPA